MFSAPETKAQLQIANKLQTEGFEPYLPQDATASRSRQSWRRSAFPSSALRGMCLEVTEFARKLVFALDVFQCLTGAQPSCSTSTDECRTKERHGGFARVEANKPVVIYKTTFVTMLGGLDNPMVSGLGMQWASVDKLPQLPGR